MIHIENSISIARWYDEPDGFEKKKPYRAICSIFFIDRDHAFIYGMHGKLNKADMKELFEQLYLMGVLKITAERKGKLTTRDVAFLLDKA